MARNHQTETAEAHMVTGVATATQDETVKEVVDRFAGPKPYFETIAYTYVLDGEGHLVGAVSMKELLNTHPLKKMKNIMRTGVIAVKPGLDQERVAMTAIRHRLKAIPVIDKERRLLGVVPARAIFNILHWEHTEDMLRLSGLQGRGRDLQNAVEAGIMKMSMMRLPVLFIGLLGGLLATTVVQQYESTLASQLVLAFFIPIILYLSAAVGTQTGTILIRTLATEEVDLWRYVVRELIIGVIIAVVIGASMLGIVYAWHGLWPVAVTIGISLCISITVASGLGLLIPWLLHKLKKDPAISGGPLINVLEDIMTLFIYFTVATIILL